MIRCGSTMLLVALACASPAIAQNARYGPEYQRCANLPTVDLVACVARLTAAWDRRLNAAYQARLGNEKGEQRQRLQAAQRLWIQFRDANFAYQGGGEGSISRVAAAECRRSMTRDRALELEEEG